MAPRRWSIVVGRWPEAGREPHSSCRMAQRAGSSPASLSLSAFGMTSVGFGLSSGFELWFLGLADDRRPMTDGLISTTQTASPYL